ncbi:Histidinol phosphatase and related hydrolases of the PHP family [Archaeoglobus sulfaticallidus PM70-1]|uniref:Histidinol phosphatase and related hydrolases of the PHP family n=1 Tax=Archaeoglobus sulfaticallidus PM70-1 TaxID=387631 RepID=N0BBT8_9EURY|nr:histidinol phosphate phosphatase domain-containing protein [Archaeoglobus sulfaticallidus]AGK61064.1 Histidinol phosphatase and related hydrolases of the PHP family [Archaeoglobus sulfaticallidus PM70-1]
MIDLHVHSIFSDGELVPSEIARRMAEIGNEGMAVTDHADFSNIKDLMKKLDQMKDYRDDYELDILFGVEVTHVPPRLIGKAVEMAWREGAEIVVVHGETVAEPVKEGTNYHALCEEIDILAHPGFIDEKCLELARENGIYLEITSRKGHCLTNGYVAKKAEEFGCRLVVNTDSHSPSDFIDTERAIRVVRGAGIVDYGEILENSKKLMEEKLKKLKK